jgi:hypothetical protein
LTSMKYTLPRSSGMTSGMTSSLTEQPNTIALYPESVKADVTPIKASVSHQSRLVAK